jgi:hypothetical protein
VLHIFLSNKEKTTRSFTILKYKHFITFVSKEEITADLELKCLIKFLLYIKGILNGYELVESKQRYILFSYNYYERKKLIRSVLPLSEYR